MTEARRHPTTHHPRDDTGGTTRRGRATRLAWLPTLLGVLALAAIGQAQGQAGRDRREQQIAEIQKQIDELNKKLDALRKAGDGEARRRGRRARRRARVGQGAGLAVDRPGEHGRADRRPLGLRGRPDHLLGRHRLRRPAQDDQQRHHLRAPVRPGRRPSPSATSASPRRTRTSSGSAPARTTRGTRSPTATASTSRPTAARPGRTWA